MLLYFGETHRIERNIPSPPPSPARPVSMLILHPINREIYELCGLKLRHRDTSYIVTVNKRSKGSRHVMSSYWIRQAAGTTSLFFENNNGCGGERFLHSNISTTCMCVDVDEQNEVFELGFGFPPMVFFPRPGAHSSSTTCSRARQLAPFRRHSEALWFPLNARRSCVIG